MVDLSSPLRVVKLGGSLLWQPETPECLRRWLSQQPARRQLWIVGGGQLVDGIRDFDASFGLSPTTAHELSLQLMQVTADLLASQFPAWPVLSVICGPESTLLQPIAENTILRPADWSQHSKLPPSWEVTSDSIAAEIAIALGAAELVLLKSCPIPNVPASQWSDFDLVDRWFHQLDLSGVDVIGVELPKI